MTTVAPGHKFESAAIVSPSNDSPLVRRAFKAFSDAKLNPRVELSHQFPASSDAILVIDLESFLKDRQTDVIREIPGKIVESSRFHSPLILDATGLDITIEALRRKVNDFAEVAERVNKTSLDVFLERYRHLEEITQDWADSHRSPQNVIFPTKFKVVADLLEPLRYGENPHQFAALYRSGEPRPGVALAKRVQGKQLSYNNICDTDAAYECVAEFDSEQVAAVAIIKHANPCGVAQAADLPTAYAKALRCDPVSAFGGIVAVNRILDAKTAAEISKIFTEVIIAPDITPEAREILRTKKNVRVLIAGGVPDPTDRAVTLRTVSGGILVHQRDFKVFNGEAEAPLLKVMTNRAPTEAEMADLQFAFRVAKHVKSNAIVYAKDGATIGIGAGQTSRVDSSRIAAWKAEEAANAASLPDPLATGFVVASDAFFPFDDGLVAAAKAGARAIIQPGGSIRDEDVIRAANEWDIAMVFTRVRHFRH